MCPESLKTHHAVPLFHFAGIRLFRQAFPISVHDLHRRQRRLGSAGAGFGLFYYLLIGAGLLLVGWGQALGPTLGLCGVAALLLCLARRRQQG